MPGFDDERIRIDGQRVDADITARLTAARLKHTMEGSSSIDLTVDDHDLELLRSGVFTRPGKPNKAAAKVPGFDQAAWERFGTSRLTLDGAFFRLAGVSGNYASSRQLTITFEDEIAALMRQQHKALATSRGQMTRAEFIHRLARLAMGLSRTGVRVPFGFFSPQEGQRQPIAEPDLEHARKGIHPDKHLTVKGFQITDEQRRNVLIALGVADDERAGERATLAMLVAGIGESSFLAIPNSAGSNYWGVFQGSKDVWKLTDTKGMARSFLKGGKGFQAGGAIVYAAQHPDATPGEIATKVEASGEPGGFYDAYKVEAAAILDAYGGTSQVHTIREAFIYRAGGKDPGGKKRNYWDDSGTLTDEVRWRRFANANILWFVSDEWLFSRKPLYVLRPESEGLLGFDFTADVGIPVAEINLTARAARWTTPPGAVFDIEDLGPLTGRWLCWISEEDLFTGEVSITLHRPAPAKKEPVKFHTATTSEETPEAGTVRSEIVRLAKKAVRERSRFRYGSTRPMHSSLFGPVTPTGPGGQTSPLAIDCSEFVTLIYKAAGAPDPNGLNYNGTGNTATLISNGTKTSDPQPGDLVHYGPGSAGPASHVGIYIGGGKVIEMGGTPGPLELAVKYRSDFAGYYAHDLGP